MRIVVVTGLSGSGKSVAIRALEDAGYYAIDNLPIALFDKLIELSTFGKDELAKLALVVDTRDVQGLGLMPSAIQSAREQGHEVEVVFLDASDAAIERRFSETRRRHPLDEGATIKEAIEHDRALLEPLRAAATRIIDTSTMSIHELRREVTKLVSGGPQAIPLGITVVSFGYRQGVPNEADLVFDVRFLPNPFFVESLRALTGEDEACASYVLERPESQAFLGLLYPMLKFLLPQYEFEGKAYLTIAFGCTGGQHRSVAIARTVADWLRKEGREVRVRHRDIRKALPGASRAPPDPT
ncbi:MAG: RNase adapter RapZ [Myxococcota bacterium]